MLFQQNQHKHINLRERVSRLMMQ